METFDPSEPLSLEALEVIAQTPGLALLDKRHPGLDADRSPVESLLVAQVTRIRETGTECYQIGPKQGVLDVSDLWRGEGSDGLRVTGTVSNSALGYVQVCVESPSNIYYFDIHHKASTLSFVGLSKEFPMADYRARHEFLSKGSTEGS